MAAAEARAAWQRTANRCFVQEDAKRAPKLACCPSASSSSKQADGGPTNGTEGHDKTNVGFFTLNRNLSHPNLPLESRWWLQLQPNYGYQKALNNEQINTSEADMEIFADDVFESVSEAREISEINGQLKDTCYIASALCMKKSPEIERQVLKTVYDKTANSQESLKPDSIGESYEFVEMDPIGSSVCNQTKELSFESDTPWMGARKMEPWWRTADRDELAYLVAQRSLDLIDNCDLPQPQNTRSKGDPHALPGHFDNDEILPASKEFKAGLHSFSNSSVNRQNSPSLGSTYDKRWTCSEEQSPYDPEEHKSGVQAHEGIAETQTQVANGDPSKAQLLEALCHSQTRAREAEKAAKLAHAEKEHVLKLVFRQASHLFAYKQWLQLLQLENLYFQIKSNNGQPISILFPMVLPWRMPRMPQKPSKVKKRWQKPVRCKRGKRGPARHDISKLTVAFALGFSLVGAGLLLGWTIGWMLPTF
ncbi:hypothetical protein NMG60_11022706 [Bertholletia excelsa]